MFKGKKLLFISIIIFGLLSACQNIEAPDSDSGEASIHEEWKWQNPGFEGKSVEKINLSSDDRSFVLSEGKIYYQAKEAWLAENLEEEVSAFALWEKNNKLTIIAGSINGTVYIKNENDEKWEKADIECFSRAINIIVVSSGDDCIYLGQSSKDGGGLWRSNDGGKTWAKVTDTTVRGIAVHPENPDIIYIVDRLTYLSTDGGNNWKKLETPANYGVLIPTLYPDIAYIVYSNGVVTTNHEGAVSTNQRFFLPGGINRLEYNPAINNEWALGIWDYPAGTGGLYYSMTGGTHWIEVGEELVNTRILDLCFNNAGDKLYIGTADRGLWILNLPVFKDDL